MRNVFVTLVVLVGLSAGVVGFAKSSKNSNVSKSGTTKISKSDPGP